MEYPIEFEMWWTSHSEQLREPVMKDVAYTIWNAAKEWV